jgi:DNA-binding transcriptional LysR family regulator
MQHVTTVPTELLRTLVAVVDLRSFTKAAQSLGVTQPAVSAQIKRLQALLGGDLLDKTAPGVSLTHRGEVVVDYARRLLEINDRILHLAIPRAQPPLRIGVPGDFAGSVLPATFAAFRARNPGVRFYIRGDISDNLLRDLRQGHLDVVVALTTSEPLLDARHRWAESVTWVSGPATFAADEPVPLVSFGEGSVTHRLATTLLSQAGRECDLVFTTFSLAALLAAVRAGLGIALVPARSVAGDADLRDHGTLPAPPDVCCAIYLRDGMDRQRIEELADTMAEALRPPAVQGAAGSTSGWPRSSDAPADSPRVLRARGRH